MRIATRVLVWVFLVAAVGATACSHPERERLPIGPDVHASMVALFQPGVSNPDIDRFLEQTVFMGPADGEHRQRPGLRSILRVHVVGHDGYAMTFFPAATPEQRAKVRSDMEASPIVLKVFDNIAPADIRPEHLISSGP